MPPSKKTVSYDGADSTGDGVVTLDENGEPVVVAAEEVPSNDGADAGAE